MKKKGFTLVELLAVIVILGLLSAIAAIAALNIKKVQDAKNNANMVAGILTGAKKYAADNPDFNGSTGVSLNDLVGDGYVDVDKTKISSGIIKTHTCSNSYKRAFYINVEGNNYNDCGCIEQPSDTTNKSKTICTGTNGTEQIDQIEIQN